VRVLDRPARDNSLTTTTAGRIAYTFRFICPSYYIPGGQDWGAF
jgi:hypothetical protein